MTDQDAKFASETEFRNLVVLFSTTKELETRRDSARRIRALARSCPWLADQLPDSVWNEVYHVRMARGTDAP